LAVGTAHDKRKFTVSDVCRAYVEKGRIARRCYVLSATYIHQRSNSARNRPCDCCESDRNKCQDYSKELPRIHKRQFPVTDKGPFSLGHLW
jgi:hypothetical protein